MGELQKDKNRVISGEKVRLSSVHTKVKDGDQRQFSTHNRGWKERTEVRPSGGKKNLILQSKSVCTRLRNGDDDPKEQNWKKKREVRYPDTFFDLRECEEKGRRGKNSTDFYFQKKAALEKKKKEKGRWPQMGMASSAISNSYCAYGTKRKAICRLKRKGNKQ